MGVDEQVDTYFKTLYGRLKLREGHIENSLILYNRPNESGPKTSEVNLVKLNPQSGMKEILKQSNGIQVVVKKQREIYFIDNVKFHIDSVDQLGDFVEIEAIDDDGSLGKGRLQKQCEYYMNLFRIQKEHCIDKSYCDLILENK